ncbi:MAG: hypothetical protein LBG50_03235, partial [Clostridiales Family XIII bacterium]|nr:hypothetical protein [Clostridiales Family XIII bacterium]
YKGQKISIALTAKNKVTLKSDKPKIVSVKRGKKKGKNYYFTITAKKAGKATLAATAKKYKTNKYVITVKKSYPVGSEKNPVALGSSWKTIKSVNGKKQVKVKTTVLSGAQARAQILALEGEKTDGTANFDKNYYTNQKVTAGRTLYLIKVDYSIVKGYSGGVVLAGLMNKRYCGKDYKTLSYIEYAGSGKFATSSGTATNGKSGTYYTAVFLDSAVKEVRNVYAANILDEQKLGKLGTSGLVVSGCVSQKLP